MLSLLLFAQQALSERWAVVYCGSRSFYNYRHTADAFYQHYILAQSIPADHVICMCYDDIVDSSSNPFKGQIFRSLDHKNVYPGRENIKYSGAATTAANFYKVLLGDSSAGPALKSTDKDDVFVFFDNHGGDGILGVPEGCGPYIYAKDLRDTFQKMYDTKMYRNLFFPITACYAGSVAKVIDGVPRLYIMTASNDHESSYACLYDSALGTYLSSEFSVIMHTDMEQNPDSTLADAYPRVRDQVTQSHVMEYGSREVAALTYETFVGRPAKNTQRMNQVSRIFASETTARLSQLDIAAARRDNLFNAAYSFEANLEKAASDRMDKVIDGLKVLFTTNAVNFDKPCENINWNSYKTVIGFLQNKFGYLGEDFYAKTRYFSNLCSVATAQEIIDAVNKLA